MYKYKQADGSWLAVRRMADGTGVAVGEHTAPLRPHLLSPTGEVVPLPSSVKLPLSKAPLPTSSQLLNRRHYGRPPSPCEEWAESYYIAGESILPFCEYDLARDGRSFGFRSFFTPTAQQQLWEATKGACEESGGANKDVLEFVLGRAKYLRDISTVVNLAKASSKSLRRLLKQNFHAVVFGKGF